MRPLAFVLFTLSSISAIAQNTVPLFPCAGKPAGGNCPAIAGAPAGFDPRVTKDEYYDVFVETVCINQPDSWWKKKLVHVEVTIKTGTVNQTIPVYAQRTGGDCHIGIANYPLLTSIPANNNRLTIASHIYRSDDQDGLQQILGFMVGQQKNTVLNTYAATAVPYLTAVGDVATQVYKAFASHSENFQDFKDMDLVPTGPVPTRFDLKDEYIVVYAGNKVLKDADVYLDSSANLTSVATDSIVADGSTWLVFRIQKRQHRLDYTLRPWYTDYEQLIRDVKTRTVDEATVRKRIATDNTLLNADADYTNGDKDYYSDLFLKTQTEMITYLGNANASPTDYDTAIESASVTPNVTGVNAEGKVITAIDSTKPVVLQPTALIPFVYQPHRAGFTMQLDKLDKIDPQTLDKVIVPAEFLTKLKAMNQAATK